MDGVQQVVFGQGGMNDDLRNMMAAGAQKGDAGIADTIASYSADTVHAVTGSAIQGGVNVGPVEFIAAVADTVAFVCELTEGEGIAQCGEDVVNAATMKALGQAHDLSTSLGIWSQEEMQGALADLMGADPEAVQAQAAGIDAERVAMPLGADMPGPMGGGGPGAAGPAGPPGQDQGMTEEAQAAADLAEAERENEEAIAQGMPA